MFYLLSSIFLKKNRYTYGNPAVSLVRSGEKRARGSTVIRYFHDNEWRHIKSCLETMPSDNPGQAMEAARTRYMISITYGPSIAGI